MLVPQAMGAETGAIFYAVTASTEFWLLLTILLAKFLLTVVAVGLAVPGGVIGPVFGIGILAGTLLAFLPGICVRRRQFIWYLRHLGYGRFYGSHFTRSSGRFGGRDGAVL